MVRAEPILDLESEARNVAEDLREGRLLLPPEAEPGDLWRFLLEELARRCPGAFDPDYDAALQAALPDRPEAAGVDGPP